MNALISPPRRCDLPAVRETAGRPGRSRAADASALPAVSRTAGRSHLRGCEMSAFIAYLLLPLIGIGIWRLDAVKKLDLGGRIAVAGAAGAAIVAAVLAALSMVSIP